MIDMPKNGQQRLQNGERLRPFISESAVPLRELPKQPPAVPLTDEIVSDIFGHVCFVYVEFVPDIYHDEAQAGHGEDGNNFRPDMVGGLS